VTVQGQDIWSVSPGDFARQLAYVPQNFDGNLELTVEEMVSLGRNPHQQWWQWQSSVRDQEAVQKALAASELLTLKSKLLSQLSGGEKQRAAVATALAQEPKFLLLDEPTANLDFKHQLDLLKMLRELREQGLGIMLVLHDLNMMAKVADRVILLERVSADSPGRIAVDGTAESTLTEENLRRIFEIEVHPFKDPNTGQTYFNPFAGSR
jgi:iron complex transport system ATP-binding protein